MLGLSLTKDAIPLSTEVKKENPKKKERKRILGAHVFFFSYQKPGWSLNHQKHIPDFLPIYVTADH